MGDVVPHRAVHAHRPRPSAREGVAAIDGADCGGELSTAESTNMTTGRRPMPGTLKTKVHLTASVFDHVRRAATALDAVSREGLNVGRALRNPKVQAASLRIAQVEIAKALGI